MHKYREKISRIMDELLMFQFNAGATDIRINLNKMDDGILVHFESDVKDNAQESVDLLERCLKGGRNEAMEEYFWELAGGDEGSDSAELQLIGHMIDDADVKLDGNHLQITVFKKYQ